MKTQPHYRDTVRKLSRVAYGSRGAQLLDARRLDSSLTLEQVAARVDLAKGDLYRLLSAKQCNARLQTLVRIRDKMGVPIDEWANKPAKES